MLCEFLTCQKLGLLVLTLKQVKRSAEYSHPFMSFSKVIDKNRISFTEYKYGCLGIPAIKGALVPKLGKGTFKIC